MPIDEPVCTFHRIPTEAELAAGRYRDTIIETRGEVLSDWAAPETEGLYQLLVNSSLQDVPLCEGPHETVCT